LQPTFAFLSIFFVALFWQLPPAGGEAGPPFKAGIAARSFMPDKAYYWRGAQTRSLLTTIWYPASDGAVEQPQWIGPPDSPLFHTGNAAPGAKLSPTPARFPLIVLSHGTGGSALMMGWLGTVLARNGYIAAAVNHPGNNALEAYTVPGFSLRWERATDLSEVIDQMIADSTFGGRIDARRIGAAGFSLGGYTMIEIAGGITDRSAYRAFCQSPKADGICKAPPEFPDLVERFNRLDDLAKADSEIRDSLRRESESHRDPRVRAVFAIAPALGPAFRPEGLGAISMPVGIVAGIADEIVPVGSSARYFASHIPKARLTLLEGGVGHYVFLGTCTDQGRKARPLLCVDAPGMDRDTIHQKTGRMAVEFFRANLN
jgi:predicted dienelactone hydrolase